MRKLSKIFLLISLSTVFVACQSGQNNNPVDYSWTNVSLKVTKSNQTGDRFYDVNGAVQKTKGENDVIVFSSWQGMSATAIAFLSNNLAVVSYHANDGSYNGGLELVAYKNGFTQVYGGLDFSEGRVNNVITDGNNRVFAAVDTRKGPILIALEVVDNGFFVKETLQGIYLNGESANGLLFSQENGVDYIYSATGGDGYANASDTESNLNFDGITRITKGAVLEKPGFQKTRVEGLNLTPVMLQGNGNNRGKWIAKNGTAILTMHFSGYVNNTYTHAALQYYPNYVQQFSNRISNGERFLERMTLMKGKNVLLLEEGTEENTKIAYLCGGDKGFQSVRIAPNDPVESRFTVVDKFEKLTYAAAIENNTAYLACGELGVKVVTTDNGVFTAQKYFKLPNAQGAANFIAVKGDYVYVAYGKDGILSIHKNSPLFKAGNGE